MVKRDCLVAWPTGAPTALVLVVGEPRIVDDSLYIGVKEATTVHAVLEKETETMLKIQGETVNQVSQLELNSPEGVDVFRHNNRVVVRMSLTMDSFPLGWRTLSRYLWVSFHDENPIPHALEGVGNPRPQGQVLRLLSRAQKHACKVRAHPEKIVIEVSQVQPYVVRKPDGYPARHVVRQWQVDIYSLGLTLV
jgi:hypothetical protein